MANSTNASTFSFGGSGVSAVVSIGYSVGGQDIDVTDLSDTSHLYEVGIDDLEVTIELVGETTIARGDTGAISIGWNSGGTDTIASAVCTSVETSGSLDDKITSSLTFKPTPA